MYMGFPCKNIDFEWFKLDTAASECFYKNCQDKFRLMMINFDRSLPNTRLLVPVWSADPYQK